MFHFGKWREIACSLPKNCDSFYGQYTTAVSVLNACKSKIVSNFTHNICHFLFLTSNDITVPK